MNEPTDFEGHERVPLVAEVAVAAGHGTADGAALSYAVPEPLADQLAVGRLIWVPLRKQVVLGLVLALHRDEVPFTLRPITALVEPPFRLDQDRLDLARWLARETATTLFAAAAPFFPPGVAARRVEHKRLRRREPGTDAEADADLTPAQRRLLAFVTDQGGEVDLAAAQSALGSSLTSVVAALERRKLIERVADLRQRTPAPAVDRFLRLVPSDEDQTARAPKQRAVVDYLVQRARLAPVGGDGLVPLADVLARTGTDLAIVGALRKKGVVEEVARPRAFEPSAASTAPPTLTAAQAEAWREVERALTDRDPTPMLLHGVTGSGKTEVYLRAVAWCLRHGRSSLILVPEIALTSQVVARFTSRFPGQVAVLHSALSDGERYANWQSIAAGRFRVVVGPRSALFAPVSELGLIVLDEEHDGAFKQEGDPRYHARALAEAFAAQQGAVVLLGSATPAVETFWRSEVREVQRLSLPARVGPDLPQSGREGERARGALELPEVEVVDMRQELHRGNASLFSEPLRALLDRTLAAREQAILLLNRRGLATVVLCRSCGARLLCPFCDIPLVYHQDRGRLLCHRCDHREAPPAGCVRCAGPLNYFGAGTQRVEEEVQRLLPGARVLRWDRDSVRREGGHERMLRRVERREIDVIVGTQMIAKGLDLPLVTAIGVIHADTTLHLPDFRAGERTFQLLTQVAGRAGRRAPGSRVVVQSYTPTHYAIQAAARHDYDTFYAEEIDFRRAHAYPPFTRLVRYLYRDADEAKCATEAEAMARVLARHAHARNVPADLLGPTPAFASRVRGRYQWQIILRAGDLDPLLDGLPTRFGWTVDVDPQSLL